MRIRKILLKEFYQNLLYNRLICIEACCSKIVILYQNSLNFGRMRYARAQSSALHSTLSIIFHNIGNISEERKTFITYL